MAWSNEFQAVYANRAALLSASTNESGKIKSGTLGVVENELGNLYTYDAINSKWVVHSMNRYTTALMPTETDFIIPDYTRLIDITTGSEFIQQP